MSSLRNYGDSGAYRSRTGIASNSTFGRNATTGSNFSNYRTNYTGIGSSSLKTSTTKDRSIGNIYTGNFTKKDGDKAEEKASYKYSFNKNSEKERLTPGDISKDDQRTRGRSSNGPSMLDKYTLGSGKIASERSASVLDKYRGNRESSGKSPRYGASNSYSESSRSYAGEKKEREQEAAATKGPRFASSRASQEPSPEVAGKTSGQRGRSQLAGKNGQSSNYPESSTSSTSSPRYNGRHSHVSRNNAERILSDGIGFTRSDKFHNAAAKLQPSPVVDEAADRDQKCHNTDSRSDAAALDTSLPLATNSPKNKQEKLHDMALTDNSKRCDKEDSAENEVIIISVVTRGTSPTPPPPLTAYARTKRLEPLPKVVRREVNKSELNKVERCAKEQQVDCVVGEGSSRGRYTPRYNSAATGRAFGVPWVSSYLDKFSSSASASNPGLYSSRSTCNISHNRASTDSPGCSKAMDESSKSSTKSSTIGSSTNLIQYSAHNTQHHNRCNSGSSTLAKEVDRPSAKVDSSQKRRKAALSDGEERKSNASREETPRVSGGQDHGQGLATSSSRKESSSKLSDGNSSAHGKSASVSRSGSLKLRHTTSAQSPPSINGPVGCNSANGDRSNSSRGMKYVNKDFRKSALNMENGDPSRSQISDRKNQKKYQRSVSVSSQDSQSESNSGSTTMLQQVASFGSLVSLKPTKLASKHKAPPTKANIARKGDVKGPERDGRKSSSKSPPSSSNRNIARTVSISTSECSFDGSSSDTSISDADDNEPAKAKQDIRKKRTPNAPFQERKGKTSLDSSKTSVLVSSADELSINTDKPPRPPSTPRSRNDRSGKTDEAKSFLIRTLAPVANNFKIKQQESADEISRAEFITKLEHNEHGKQFNVG
ncbi:PREDICTED: uncharacterized protein LOC105367679 [Ceratosolen solmsi marchali]|uniref:Uncharacterized protein LOC105367679 n=1 Tax=Ceratosolen solmsi marchali TaxID=326594 RepID=A0AAJ6YUM6_9HYME|nr:PREDICTED: uncharacterized protein LOC105367679 [Ceratosolen solmsi marchali]